MIKLSITTAVFAAFTLGSCTINQRYEARTNVYNSVNSESSNDNKTIHYDLPISSAKAGVLPVPVPQRKCGVAPIGVIKPVRVDHAKLMAAADEQAMVKILLDNIGQLDAQIKNANDSIRSHNAALAQHCK